MCVCAGLRVCVCVCARALASICIVVTVAVAAAGVAECLSDLNKVCKMHIVQHPTNEVILSQSQQSAAFTERRTPRAVTAITYGEYRTQRCFTQFHFRCVGQTQREKSNKRGNRLLPEEDNMSY